MERRLASLSAFFPVRDEEANVVPMADACLAALPAIAVRWELVIVDDGSRDATGALADGLARRHAGIRVVRHPTSRGYGAAVRSGLAASRFEYVFLTDGDRQFAPADLARLVPALADADVVVGYRRRRADPLARRIAGRAWNLLVRALFRLPVRDVNCAMKLFRRSALAGVVPQADGSVISTELLVRLRERGVRIAEVPVEHFPRRRGRASGGDLRVVARAVPELVRLYRDVATPLSGASPSRSLTS